MARRGKPRVGIVSAAAAAWIIIAIGGSALAGAAGMPPDGPFPRFESLRADRVNLRAGPGVRYPIEWVMTKRDMPVEVLAAFEHWRKVRDWQGTLGWVEEKMVWDRREVIVTGGVRALRQDPDDAAPLVARAEPGVIGQLLETRGDWCRIQSHDISGWVRRSDVWGIRPDESVP